MNDFRRSRLSTEKTQFFFQMSIPSLGEKFVTKSRYLPVADVPFLVAEAL